MAIIETVNTTLLSSARELRDQLRQISALDIAYIIYTHQHFDLVMDSAFLTKRTTAYHGAIGGMKYLETNLARNGTACPGS
jgi:glyoxylase-like metal-dependent hydrolase (beta-lactamase superfamily II)